MLKLVKDLLCGLLLFVLLGWQWVVDKCPCCVWWQSVGAITSWLCIGSKSPGGGGIHNYQASIEIKYSDCAKDFNSNVLRILFRVCIVKRILILAPEEQIQLTYLRYLPSMGEVFSPISIWSEETWSLSSSLSLNNLRKNKIIFYLKEQQVGLTLGWSSVVFAYCSLIVKMVTLSWPTVAQRWHTVALR